MKVKPSPHNLIIKILLGIIIGAIIGFMSPNLAQHLKFFADIFIKLIKVVVSPIIFCTVTLGIVSHSDIKKAGIIGIKTLIYFEIITTLALFIGLLFVNLIKPGLGLNIHEVSHVNQEQYNHAINNHNQVGFLDHIKNIIPDSFFSGFVNGDLLQILFISVLFGIAVLLCNQEIKHNIKTTLDQLNTIFFQILHIIIKLAPIAVCGAIAYTVAKFGIGLIFNFAEVIATVYLSMLVFVFIILGAICYWYGINLINVLSLIKEELIITFGTCSSEAVLPRVMEKLINHGCDSEVVGLVLPMGYSFNLAGTAIYLSIATLFIAQAYGIDLSWQQQLLLMGILMITSKGSAAVVGGGLVTLTASLAVSNMLPIEGLALIVGIDRFLSEGRSLTNLIGNTVAVFIIDKTDNKSNQRSLVKQLSK